MELVKLCKTAKFGLGLGMTAHKRRAEITTGCRIFWLANGLNKLKKGGMDVDDAVSLRYGLKDEGDSSENCWW